MKYVIADGGRQPTGQFIVPCVSNSRQICGT